MSEFILFRDAYRKVEQIVREPINVYVYGSRLYGCNNMDADVDIVVITENITTEATWDKDCGIDLSLYSINTFKQMIADHEIVALECLFAPGHRVLRKDVKFDFTLDHGQLRNSLSAKASNSFVKAKKKFDVEHEPYLAKKSLFHSLRILMFGIQIAEYGRITDYTAANLLWREIMDNPATDWATYKKQYKPIYNNLKTLFKKAAPK